MAERNLTAEQIQKELDNNAQGYPGLRGALDRPGRGLFQKA